MSMNKRSMGCRCCLSSDKKKIVCPAGTQFIVPKTLAAGTSVWNVSVDLFNSRAAQARTPDSWGDVRDYTCSCDTFNGDYVLPVGYLDAYGLPISVDNADYSTYAMPCDFYDWNQPGVYVGKMFREQVTIMAEAFCGSPYPMLDVRVTIQARAVPGSPYDNNSHGHSHTWGGRKYADGSVMDLTQPITLPGIIPPGVGPAVTVGRSHSGINEGRAGYFFLYDGGPDYSCFDWPDPTEWPGDGYSRAGWPGYGTVTVSLS